MYQVRSISLSAATTGPLAAANIRFPRVVVVFTLNRSTQRTQQYPSVLPDSS